MKYDTPEYRAGLLLLLEEWSAQARAAYNQGDARALLMFVDKCIFHELPVPAWAQNAWRDRFDGWERFGYRSLDEAFGVERPKGMNLAAERRRIEMADQVASQIHHSRKRGSSLADSLTLAAELFNVSEATARRWYDAERAANPQDYPLLKNTEKKEHQFPKRKR